jgi:hypothetical protein
MLLKLFCAILPVGVDGIGVAIGRRTLHLLLQLGEHLLHPSQLPIRQQARIIH